MTMWMIFVLIIFSSLILYQLLCIVFFVIAKKDHEAKDLKLETYPMVSILIAARNEENNIKDCLDAVVALSYPSNRLECLVGNDHSEDATALLVQQYADKYSFIKLVNITTTLPNTKGKANVLAQLAQHAKGEFYFITDADVQVPTHWIQSLLVNQTKGCGVVTGFTMVHSGSLFAAYQQLDWAYGFMQIKAASDAGIPVTCAGNNMMITAEAYKATGGYEHIPFSLTEDHELFVHTLNKGYGYKNLMHEDCVAMTYAQPSWLHLLKQRKRWTTGFVKVPLLLRIYFYLIPVYLPMLFVGLTIDPILTLSLWGLNFLLRQVNMILTYRRIRFALKDIFAFLTFEFYFILSIILVAIYFVLPVKIQWKGRNY